MRIKSLILVSILFLFIFLSSKAIADGFTWNGDYSFEIYDASWVDPYTEYVEMQIGCRLIIPFEQFPSDYNETVERWDSLHQQFVTEKKYYYETRLQNPSIINSSGFQGNIYEEEKEFRYAFIPQATTYTIEIYRSGRGTSQPITYSIGNLTLILKPTIKNLQVFWVTGLLNEDVSPTIPKNENMFGICVVFELTNEGKVPICLDAYGSYSYHDILKEDPKIMGNLTILNDGDVLHKYSTERIPWYNSSLYDFPPEEYNEVDEGYFLRPGETNKFRLEEWKDNFDYDEIGNYTVIGNITIANTVFSFQKNLTIVENRTLGFELVIVLCAIAIAIFLCRRQKL